MNPLLTVVIPYYKRRYFEATLESLARQTNDDFDVFIGDDCSPENPSEVIGKYQGQLRIKYRRFANNLGKQSLVAQWNRCVRETSSEWVWLFSDDDEVSPECIADFYSAIAKTGAKFDLYRFNTKVIDGSNKTVYDPLRHPAVETEAEFLFAKFSQRRNSCAVEYIFRRDSFEAAGGFVNFPLAWCSDDASWLAFSRRTGIYTMPEGKVFWRLSDLNLSAANPGLVGLKLKAFRKYLLWLRREFKDPAIQKKLREEVGKWFPDQIPHWGGKPNLFTGIGFWCFFSWFTHQANFDLLSRLIHVPRVRGYGLRRFFKRG